MSQKVALITGITGQDGTYLTQLLLEKGYRVHGICRRTSTSNTTRLKPYLDQIELHMGDLTDANTLYQILEKVAPDELYNLAAQSHVGSSFETPEYTANVNGLGVTRLLEAIRHLGLLSTVRFYQASTSELFGKAVQSPQNETTPFAPRSPYAIAKLYGYWMVRNYRESYGLYGCNGILFNHESPLRGENFVTRKITRGLGRIALGLQEEITLGNLEALRDWGHAKDFVEMQWRILQQEKADDYIIATGKQFSVRQAVIFAAEALGLRLEWHGEGVGEYGQVVSAKQYPKLIGKTIVRVDQNYFRPSEVETLLGDPSKAIAQLQFTPRISFQEMIYEMAEADLRIAEQEARLCI